MARIKATTLTVEYQTVRLAQAQANEKNDCTVKAVALLTGSTYVTAHATMARFGRQPGKGASTFSTERAIMSLGFRLTQVDVKSVIARYPKGHCDVLKNVTSHHPRRFPKAWADGNAYLAFTAGHALAIVNGVCHDWSANKALRIYRLLKVEPNTVGRHYDPFAEPHASVDRATAFERAKPVIATTEKFGVWCTVSGGVTGFREGWFKTNGEVKVFATVEEASEVAVRLNAGMSSPYSKAKFNYEARPIPNAPLTKGPAYRALTTDERCGVAGGGLLSHVDTTINELTRLFGNHIGASYDGKVRVEWVIRDNDGNVLTIYDWKTYRDLGKDELYRFHIGGKDHAAAEQLRTYIVLNGGTR